MKPWFEDRRESGDEAMTTSVKLTMMIGMHYEKYCYGLYTSNIYIISLLSV